MRQAWADRCGDADAMIELEIGHTFADLAIDIRFRAASRWLALFGDSGAGKSCRCRALSRPPDSAARPTTIGIDLAVLSLVSQRLGRLVEVALWDTAGQERFNSVVPIHAKGADIVLAVFDVTDYKHMVELVEKWGTLHEMSEDRDCKVVLVGAKFDIDSKSKENHEQVEYLDEEQVKLFAMEHGYDDGIVVSAKESVNVGSLLKLIADLAGDALEAGHGPRRQVVVVAEDKPVVERKLFSCC